MFKARFIRIFIVSLCALMLTSSACYATIGGSSRDQWRQYFTDAMTLLEKGAYKDAARDLLKSLDHVGHDVGRALATMDALERIYERTHNLEAKELVLLTHAQVLNAYFKPCSLTADVYLQLGELYSEMEKFPKAEKYFLLALPIIRSCAGPDCLTAGTTLNNLAYAELRQNKLTKAEAHFKQSLDAFAKSRGSNSEFYGLTAYNLGDVYEKTGREKQALVYFKKALDALSYAIGPSHPLTLNAKESFEAVKKKLQTEAESPGLPTKPARRKSPAPKIIIPKPIDSPLKFPDVASNGFLLSKSLEE